MRPIDLQLAGALIDFTGAASRGGEESREGRSGISPSLARSQLEGSVAAYNMLAGNGVAYVADEVGLGKTYVALGVMGLVRHFRPDARILVLAPRENIQRKWVRDSGNFVRNNWRVIDNRVKSVQGGPARKPVVCRSLAGFAHEVSVNANRDFFLRMTSFSLKLKHRKDRDRYRRQVLSRVGWLRSELQAEAHWEFREQVGRALNAILPDIDLLVVDEAHNLRRGFGSPGDSHTSNRNRILGLMLGRSGTSDDDHPWYRPRVRRVLCLSATPFEDDYGDLWRQFDVLGKGSVHVRDACGGSGLPLQALARDSAEDDDRRKLTQDLLIRRITHLDIGGRNHTKNMYRREWRHGGFTHPEEPIRFDDPRQRLVVALVQKKVAEVLGNEKFGNRFQIGMLSSFESFLQSVGSPRQEQPDEESDANEAGEGNGGAAFDGQQTQDREEQRGADTRILNALVESYEEAFGQAIPHPKLDATVEALAAAFETGEKALVFVRRVATVGELARRLDRRFDAWLRKRMKEALPDHREEIDRLFERFREETRAGADSARTPGTTAKGPLPTAASDESGHETGNSSRSAGAGDSAAGIEARGQAPGGVEDEPEAGMGGAMQPGVDDDPGGRENFFSWFFRGKGPDGVLSGAAFQKNRLSNASAAYSTLFEDDLVSWLLGRPDDPLDHLAKRLGLTTGELEDELRRLAWAYFHREHGGQAGRYPRYYAFEAHQAAALHLIARARDRLGDELANRASDVLRLRFPDHHGERSNPPPGFPAPDSAIGVTTFFTELVGHGPLRQQLWPREEGVDFAQGYRRREQRRELLSAMARLGGAYIDLYLLAIAQAGGFEGRQQDPGDRRARGNLARSFVEMLEKQRRRPDCFNAYAELKGVAEAFDPVIQVNFPEAPTADLGKLAEIFGRGLQQQTPVSRMAGRVAGRIVRQFRMPGFPLVLISTDVLQEGEDLHTFCRRVVHYGITWTPSAMEQRTGRVDRIGGLAQRTLDGRPCPARPEEKIQVLYPHLEDTVERLQVRRVLLRLNRFLRLVHATPTGHADDNPRIDANREILSSTEIPPPVEGELESAFPVRAEWLNGGADGASVYRVDLDDLRDLLDEQWRRLARDEGVEQPGHDGPLARHGILGVREHRIVPARANPGVRLQRVHLELRSAGIADATFLRCSSVVGHIDLVNKPRNFDRLRQLQIDLGQPRLCTRWDTRHARFAFSVEASLPFDRATTQYAEVRDLVRRVALQADRVEETVLDVDRDGTPPEPLHQGRASPKVAASPRRHTNDHQLPTGRRPIGLERVRELLGGRDDLEWHDRGDEILLELTAVGSDPAAGTATSTDRSAPARKQRVRIRRNGDEYVFSTVVVDAERAGKLPQSTFRAGRQHVAPGPTHALLLTAWSRNAEAELVNFTLDAANNLVGEIRHPVGHLDEAELLIYVQTLAAEGDRFEYVLTGEDDQ